LTAVPAPAHPGAASGLVHSYNRGVRGIAACVLGPGPKRNGRGLNALLESRLDRTLRELLEEYEAARRRAADEAKACPDPRRTFTLSAALRPRQPCLPLFLEPIKPQALVRSDAQTGASASHSPRLPRGMDRNWNKASPPGGTLMRTNAAS